MNLWHFSIIYMIFESRPKMASYFINRQIMLSVCGDSVANFLKTVPANITEGGLWMSWTVSASSLWTSRVQILVGL